MARLRPEQYGMHTVHTGNAKHREGITQDMRNLAKRYAKAHGYAGALGGWVYDAKGQHVAHGWSQFWVYVGGLHIIAWARQTGRRIPTSLLD